MRHGRRWWLVALWLLAVTAPVAGLRADESSGAERLPRAQPARGEILAGPPGSEEFGYGGAGPAVGALSPANRRVGAAGALIGGTGEDGFYSAVMPLPGGDYLLDNAFWGEEKGAFTLGGALGGVRGTVTAQNSALGATAYESRSYVETSYDPGSRRLLVGWWQRTQVEIVALAPPAHVLSAPQLSR